jgi:hypothetical protein
VGDVPSDFKTKIKGGLAALTTRSVRRAMDRGVNPFMPPTQQQLTTDKVAVAVMLPLGQKQT